MTTIHITGGTLFLDGLHLILAYLTPEETSRASSACRHWAVAVATEPPKSHISYRCRTHSQLAHFLRSAFAQRHTSRLIFLPRGREAMKGQLSSQHVARLTSPTLTHLEAFCAPDRQGGKGAKQTSAVNNPQGAASREETSPELMRLPTSLRTAHLSTAKTETSSHPADSNEVNWLYRSLASTPTFLTRLTMADAYVRWAEVDISPLVALRMTLRSLTISSWHSDAFTSTHIDVLKQLGALTELRAFHGEWCRTRVAHLVAAPSPLAESLETFELRLDAYFAPPPRLFIIDFQHDLESIVIPQEEEPILRLARLQSLGVDAPRVQTVAQLALLLRLLPSVRGIHIDADGSNWRRHFESPAGGILADGEPLPHVTSFGFDGTIWYAPLALSCVLSHNLARSLPHLHRLVLHNVYFDSLAFLASLRLLSSLDLGVKFPAPGWDDGPSLVIDPSRRHANGDVRLDALLDDLRGVPSLRHFYLRALEGSALNVLEVERFVVALIVPSVAVPHLRKFIDARPDEAVAQGKRAIAEANAKATAQSRQQ